MELNHRNGDTRDIRFDNLELIHHSSNMRHSWQVLGKRQALAPGVFNASAKLTLEDVRAIFVGRRDGLTQRELAAKFKVDDSAICRILAGKQYTVEVGIVKREMASKENQ